MFTCVYLKSGTHIEILILQYIKKQKSNEEYLCTNWLVSCRPLNQLTNKRDILTIDRFDIQLDLHLICKHHLLLIDKNQLIHLSQSQLLLAKTIDDETASWNSLLLHCLNLMIFSPDLDCLDSKTRWETPKLTWFWVAKLEEWVYIYYWYFSLFIIYIYYLVFIYLCKHRRYIIFII